MGLLNWLRRKFGGGTPEPKLIEGTVDPRLSKTPEELCKELDAADAQAKENAAKMDELKRAYAGLINDKQSFQKRLQKEKERAIAEGSIKVVRELVDVSDEIDRALEAAKDEKGPLADGIRMIHGSISGRLVKLGVERMVLDGKLFNPTMAEALEVVPVESADQDEVILGVFQAGYLMNGQVVREAKVRVGRYIPPAPPPEPEPAEPKPEAEAEAAPADAAQDVSAPAEGESAENAGEDGEGQKQEQSEAPSAPVEAVKADEAKPEEAKPEEAKAEESKPAESAPDAAVQPQPSDAAAAEQQPAPSAASPKAAPAADSPKAS